MKPYPFCELNHLTVPVGISSSPCTSFSAVKRLPPYFVLQVKIRPKADAAGVGTPPTTQSARRLYPVAPEIPAFRRNTSRNSGLGSKSMVQCTYDEVDPPPSLDFFACGGG